MTHDELLRDHDALKARVTRLEGGEPVAPVAPRAPFDWSWLTSRLPSMDTVKTSLLAAVMLAVGAGATTLYMGGCDNPSPTPPLPIPTPDASLVKDMKLAWQQEFDPKKNEYAAGFAAAYRLGAQAATTAQTAGDVWEVAAKERFRQGVADKLMSVQVVVQKFFKANLPTATETVLSPELREKAVKVYGQVADAWGKLQ